MTNLPSEFLSELTSEQKEVANSFYKWLQTDKEYLPFIICGYAGTGKTYLSIRLLKIVEDKGLCWTVVAPTHKALGVIRKELSSEGLKPTWFPSTIHRLLRLKLKRKGDQESIEETSQTSSSLKQLSIVLIDESSMVNKELMEIVLNCAKSFGTRIIFVGDPAQLPPINEEVSPVFNLKSSYKFLLKNVVRHQGPILNLASALRDSLIPTNEPPCLPLIKTKKSFVGLISYSEWLDRAMQSLMAASSHEDPDSARILCYTNRTLERIAPHVRRAVYGNCADEIPVLPGEVLITRTAVMKSASLNDPGIEEEPGMVLGSNRELVVRDVAPQDVDLSVYEPNENSTFQYPIIKTYEVKVKADEMNISLRLLPRVGTNSRQLLEKTLSHLKSQAKSSESVQSRALWRKFFMIRDSFAALGPASVLTIHRSQGSTFREVFISSDVFWPEDDNLRRKLLYVAVSRAKEGVWIVASKKDHSIEDLWNEVVRSN